MFCNFLNIWVESNDSLALPSGYITRLITPSYIGKSYPKFSMKDLVEVTAKLHPNRHNLNFMFREGTNMIIDLESLWATMLKIIMLSLYNNL